ncbi:MAG: hypothetical protein GY765_10010, partial [bacterium]|nr:hypothetical protein [bacterium]
RHIVELLKKERFEEIERTVRSLHDRDFLEDPHRLGKALREYEKTSQSRPTNSTVSSHPGTSSRSTGKSLLEDTQHEMVIDLPDGPGGGYGNIDALTSEFDKAVHEKDIDEAVMIFGNIRFYFNQHIQEDLPAKLSQALVNLLVEILEPRNKGRKLDTIMIMVGQLPEKQKRTFGKAFTSDLVPHVLKALLSHRDTLGADMCRAFYFKQAMENLAFITNEKQAVRLLRLYLGKLFGKADSLDKTWYEFSVAFIVSYEQSFSKDFARLVLKGILEHSAVLPVRRRIFLLIGECVPYFSYTAPADRENMVTELLNILVESGIVFERVSLQYLLIKLAEYPIKYSEVTIRIIAAIYGLQRMEEREDLRELMFAYYLKAIEAHVVEKREKTRTQLLKDKQYRLLEEDFRYHLRVYHSRGYKQDLRALIDQIDRQRQALDGNDEEACLYFESLHYVIPHDTGGGMWADDQDKLFKFILEMYKENPRFGNDTGLYLPHPEAKQLLNFRFDKIPGGGELVVFNAICRYAECERREKRAVAEIVEQ